MCPRRRLRADAKVLGSHSTDLQIAKVVERANRLKRQIDAWAAVQLLYMPAISQLRIADESDTLTSAVNGELLLPSQVLDRIPVSEDMMEIEWRLRFAQGHDALHDIRRLLLVRSQMYAAKDRFSRGQGQVTRSRNLILGVQSRIDANVLKYREFRAALLRLARPLGKVGWDGELQVLHDNDVRGLAASETGSSEGRVTMSWIWKTSEGSGDFDPAGPRMQEGKSSIIKSFDPSTNHIVQHSVSSGAGRAREHIAGRRSVYYSKRKCAGSRSISPGRNANGKSEL